MDPGGSSTEAGSQAWVSSVHAVRIAGLAGGGGQLFDWG